MNILYKITNTKNGFTYFGVTNRSIKRRWQQHCILNRPNTFLKNCLKKYGKENFVIEVINTFDTYELALEAEKFFIEKYQTNICRFPKGIGMNMTDGGDRGNIGYKTTEIHRKNLSAAMKGKKKSKRHARNISKAKKGNKNPCYGKPPSELSRETARKLFLSDANPMRGKFGKENPLFGRKRPEKVRIKIAKAVMKKAKPVYQLTMDGKIIKKFPSTQHANRAVGIKNGVHSVCMGDRKTAGGFKWRFVEP